MSLYIVYSLVIAAAIKDQYCSKSPELLLLDCKSPDGDGVYSHREALAKQETPHVIAGMIEGQCCS